jgi:hypothetical protein
MTIPGFGHPDESFMQLRGDIVPTPINRVEVTMRTCSPFGLIFLASDSTDGCIRFLSVHITDGHLDVRFDQGSGSGRVVSPQLVAICEWIMVKVR